MGQAIVKCAKDRDLYLVWSSETESVTFVGDRADIIEHLRYDSAWYTVVEAALTRADENGSSDRVVRFGWWHQKFIAVGEGTPPDGWYHIRRDNLVAYAEAIERCDKAAEWALLECFHVIGEDED